MKRNIRQAASVSGLWTQLGHTGLRSAAVAFACAVFAFGFAFAFANAFNLNVDDLTHLNPDSTFSIFREHAVNRRFVIAFASLLIKTGPGYYDYIGLWSLALSASCFYLAYELARYLQLGLLAAAWIAAAALTHGFMAEMYSFTIGHFAWAVTIGGAALTVRGLRLLPRRRAAAIAVGAVGSLLCFGSYQPFILIPAAAILLRRIRVHYTDEPSNGIWAEAVYLLAIFLVGIAATALFSLLYSSTLATGRTPSLAAARENIIRLPAVLLHMFSQRSQWGLIFPRHEKALYLIGLIALLLAPFFDGLRRPARIALAVACGLGVLVIVAGPLNIFFSPYWAPARSVSYNAFILPAAIACLASMAAERYGIRFTSALAVGAVAFVLISVANQFSLYFSRHLQARADMALASVIVADLRAAAKQENTRLEDTPIGVVGTVRNAAQRRGAFMDYQMSAFSKAWSRLPILRLVSGLPLNGFSPQPDQCAGDIAVYEIRRIEQGWVVCLN